MPPSKGAMLFSSSENLDFDQINLLRTHCAAPPAIIRSLDSLPSSKFLDLNQLSVSWRSEFAQNKNLNESSNVPQHLLPITNLVQVGNTCGPTSLAMVLISLGHEEATPQEIIQRSDYHTWLGTSPQSLANTAQSFGARSAILNHSSIKELCALLDQKTYCIALIQSGDALHYVAIYGYQIDIDEKVTLSIADPGGFNYRCDAKSFAQYWDRPSVRNIPTGIERMLIAVSNTKHLPLERFDGWCRIGAQAHSILNQSIKFFVDTLPQIVSNTLARLSLTFISILGSFNMQECRNFFLSAYLFARKIKFYIDAKANLLRQLKEQCAKLMPRRRSQKLENLNEKLIDLSNPASLSVAFNSVAEDNIVYLDLADTTETSQKSAA